MNIYSIKNPTIRKHFLSYVSTSIILIPFSQFTAEAFIVKVFSFTALTDIVNVFQILYIFGLKSSALYMVPVRSPAFLLVAALNPLRARNIFVADALPLFFIVNSVSACVVFVAVCLLSLLGSVRTIFV